MRSMPRIVGALAAALGILACGVPAVAAGLDQSWIDCQARTGPADVDQLLDTCSGAAACVVKQNAVDLDSIIAACSAVISAPGATTLQHVLAAYQRASAHMLKGQPSMAISDFGLAISLRPDFAQAYVARGAAYAAINDWTREIADDTHAISLQPRLVQAYTNRAKAYYDAGDFDRAIADATAALTLGPNNALALNEVCWLRAAANRALPAALADCDQALALSPSAPEILDSRGLVHLRMKDFHGAIADYGDALAAKGGRGVRASSLYGRGLARIGAGDATAGQQDIAAAEALSPGVAATYAKMGLTP
jgi:tetratricopeptide (TPR) repeat protein